MKETTIKVKGMMCEGCENRIKNALGEIEGIKEVEANHNTGLVKITSTNKVKKEASFEIIFMTYSFVHTKINEEAFPNSIKLYNKEIMKGGGRGKYRYKEEYRKEGEIFLKEQMKKYFPNNNIEYIV